MKCVVPIDIAFTCYLLKLLIFFKHPSMEFFIPVVTSVEVKALFFSIILFVFLSFITESVFVPPTSTPIIYFYSSIINKRLKRFNNKLNL